MAFEHIGRDILESEKMLFGMNLVTIPLTINNSKPINKCNAIKGPRD